MKNKDKQPLDGSFDPSRQLDKLDKIFAESLEQLGSFDSIDKVISEQWENVDDKQSRQTKSDIEEQFIALDESKKAKKSKDKSEPKEKAQKEKSAPKVTVPNDEDAVVRIPALEGEEEAAEQEELTSKEEYDRLFEELYYVEPPKKREPNMFKTEFRFINAACCLLCVFGIFAYLLFAQRESGFINSENRMLAEMPKLTKETYLDGSFAKDMTEYFTDTIPDREKLKRVSASITAKYGLKDEIKVANIKTAKKEVLEEPSEIVTKVTANVNIADVLDDDEESSKADESSKTDESSDTDEQDKETQTKTETKKETTTTTKKPKKETPQFDEGTVYGSVIIEGEGDNVRAISAYYGLFENSESFAKVVNSYKKDLGKKVNVYNMPIPISSAFYLPKNFEDIVASQPDNIEVMNRTLKDVISVDAYSKLAEHTDEYIYSRTDHHWQPLGAYYAGSALAEAAGVNYPDLSEYGKYVKEDFCGTMYMYSDYNEELKLHPDTFTYYKPKNEYTTYYYNTDFTGQTESELFFDYAEGVNTYSVFMGGDQTICRIDTDVKNGRTLCIIKDSFGNALVPFMVGGFEHIYVVDFRYFDINVIDFLKEIKCTDLVFAMSISSMGTPSHIETLDRIRTQ